MSEGGHRIRIIEGALGNLGWDGMGWDGGAEMEAARNGDFAKSLLRAEPYACVCVGVFGAFKMGKRPLLDATSRIHRHLELRV